MIVQVGAKLGTALVTETAATAHGDEFGLRFIDKDATYSGIDHHFNSLSMYWA
jgi:hypothetical protein